MRHQVFTIDQTIADDPIVEKIFERQAGIRQAVFAATQYRLDFPYSLGTDEINVDLFDWEGVLEF